MIMRTIATLSIVFSVGSIASSGDAQAEEKKLIAFTMEDQFSKSYTDKDLFGKLILMMASDKVGSMYSEKWALGIQKHLKTIKGSKPVLVVANLQLSDVPEFMRGAIKRLMPKEKDTRVLLDWKAEFTKPYNLQKSKCNILVFSDSGELIYQSAVTKYEASRVGTIAKLIAREQQKAKSEI